jgi:hypothetical protein
MSTGETQMARPITEQAESALRDLVGMIPQKDRRHAEEEIATLERAISLLGQALTFQRTIVAQAEQFGRSERAATLDSCEREFDRVA